MPSPSLAVPDPAPLRPPRHPRPSHHINRDCVDSQVDAASSVCGPQPKAHACACTPRHPSQSAPFPSRHSCLTYSCASPGLVRGLLHRRFPASTDWQGPVRFGERETSSFVAAFGCPPPTRLVLQQIAAETGTQAAAFPSPPLCPQDKQVSTVCTATPTRPPKTMHKRMLLLAVQSPATLGPHLPQLSISAPSLSTPHPISTQYPSGLSTGQSFPAWLLAHTTSTHALVVACCFCIFVPTHI